MITEKKTNRRRLQKQSTREGVDNKSGPNWRGRGQIIIIKNNNGSLLLSVEHLMNGDGRSTK